MSNNDNNKMIIITKETTKRLIKDVKEMIKYPLHDDGIYYQHDEDNILQGYAYISGPTNSPYFGGNYFFKFIFPFDYPHQPPKVEFNTNDGITRFHPNMYRNGKICLSLLNTWRGEQWSGCQSIKTILLTIISIMDKHPLLHEPGISINYRDVDKYNEIILFRNIDYCIINTINNIENNINDNNNFYIQLFKDNIINEFKKKHSELLSIITYNKSECMTKLITTRIYNMSIIVNWNELYDKFIKIKI